MKKQKKQLILLAVMLLVITAAYIGMRQYNGSHGEEAETETPGYQVTQDDPASVTGISLVNEKGSFAFEKKEASWYCKEDESMAVDSSLLEELIEKAVSVSSEDRIEAVEDFARYGLEEPEITVSYETADGSRTLKFGDYNASLSRYYMCLEGEDTVYTADSYLRDTFGKEAEDFKQTEEEENTTETENTKEGSPTEEASTEESGS